MPEPVLEGDDGVRTKEQIWDVYTDSLIEHRDGSEDLLQMMAELGMSDVEEQKSFVAMATEFAFLANTSFGMTVNYVQLFTLARKWGVSMDRIKQLKLLLAPDADLKL